MDWHLIEVGVVTTLSIWVYLFSTSGISRAAAATMFLLNLIWIFFERERTGKGQPEAGAEDRSDPAEGQATAEAEGSTGPRNPRII